MKLVLMSKNSLASMVASRRQKGSGRLDECWEGIWHLTDPSAKHQKISGRIFRIFSEAIEDNGRGTAWISINLTDREENWQENHRCPDGAVILKGNPGRWLGESQAAFLGGPNLVLEVLSEDDKTYEKFSFYNSLNVKEILIIDPGTMQPELWKLAGNNYEKATEPFHSSVTGLLFEKVTAGLQIADPATGRKWLVQH